MTHEDKTENKLYSNLCHLFTYKSNKFCVPCTKSQKSRDTSTCRNPEYTTFFFISAQNPTQTANGGPIACGLHLEGSTLCTSPTSRSRISQLLQNPAPAQSSPNSSHNHHLLQPSALLQLMTAPKGMLVIHAMCSVSLSTKITPIFFLKSIQCFTKFGGI